MGLFYRTKDDLNNKSFRNFGSDEEDFRKILAGFALFLTAVVVFNIPGLFQSIDAYTMDTIKLIAFLLIYLIMANEIVVESIKDIFIKKSLNQTFIMAIASLSMFYVGIYPAACATMFFYLLGKCLPFQIMSRMKNNAEDKSYKENKVAAMTKIYTVVIMSLTILMAAILLALKILKYNVL